MNKKLIAIDIDGTLLDNEFLLSPYTISVVLSLIKKGHIIILATGRPYRSLSPFYKELGLIFPVICYNGALVFNPSDPSFPLFKRSFPKDKVKRIVEEIGPRSISTMAESFEDIYISKEDEYLDHFFPYFGMKIHLGPLEETLDNDPYTTIFRSMKEDDEAIKEIVEREGLGYRHWRASKYSEVFTPNTSKGSAIAFLQKHYGITREDTIAFGDSDNDFEMLQKASMPFAMPSKRAENFLKDFPRAKANNDEDGVAKTLEELLLK
jgi:Cof subfamily protein (haloacid dehalogenase superfamily)